MYVYFLSISFASLLNTILAWMFFFKATFTLKKNWTYLAVAIQDKQYDIVMIISDMSDLYQLGNMSREEGDGPGHRMLSNRQAGIETPVKQILESKRLLFQQFLFLLKHQKNRRNIKIRVEKILDFQHLHNEELTLSSSNCR